MFQRLWMMWPGNMLSSPALVATPVLFVGKLGMIYRQWDTTWKQSIFHLRKDIPVRSVTRIIDLNIPSIVMCQHTIGKINEKRWKTIVSGGTMSFYEYIVPKAGEFKVFECSLCGKCGKDRGNLRKHVENIHFPGSFIYKCKYCSEEHTTRNLLNMHISNMHRGMTS